MEPDRPLGAEPGDPTPARPFPVWQLVAAFAVAAWIFSAVTPNYLRARSRGHMTACKSNLKNIATSLEMYAADNHGHYPRSLVYLVRGRYLKVIPTCPGAGRDTYQYRRERVKGQDGFFVFCDSDAHADVYTAFTPHAYGYPQYSADQGLIDHP